MKKSFQRAYCARSCSAPEFLRKESASGLRGRPIEKLEPGIPPNTFFYCTETRRQENVAQFILLGSLWTNSAKKRRVVEFVRHCVVLS